MKQLFLLLIAGVILAEAPLKDLNSLVDLTTVAPGLHIELRYQGTDHFFKKAYYPPEARALLRPSAAKKIAAIQADLSKRGLSLKVWDAYRPLSVQRAMWAALPDPNFVADPAKGGRHNRAAAVDVTLVDASGTELEMPTAHDDFTEKAGAYFKLVAPAAFKNRALLQEVMTKHGFLIFESEWWHFDDADWQTYPALDLPFTKADPQSKGAGISNSQPLDRGHSPGT
jgi:zinc D-Ala-D-Ala dipeptidase